MDKFIGQSDGFMPVLLSDEELEVLKEIPHLHMCLYVFGIRRHMDYKTGIVGIKRRISYQSLKEEIYVPPTRGRHTSKTVDASKTQIKRVLEFLEKNGLIKRHSKSGKEDKQLILTCLLAITDKFRLNDDDPMMTPLDDPNDGHNKNIKNTVNKGVKININRDDDPNDDPSKISMMTPPPVSGINIKHNTQQRVFFKLIEKGFSQTAAKKLMAQHSVEFISKKMEMVMSSEIYEQGKIKNLPAYLQKAIDDDFKHSQSIRGKASRGIRGDTKGSDCRAPGCKRKGVRNHTLGTRWFWFCEEHLKIEQEREKHA